MTQDIELTLQLGKLKGAKQLLKEYYEAQDKAEYEKQLRSEYDILYKTVEVIVDATYDDEDNILTEATSYMDYIEDCITFEEYKNETRVVTEGVEATYDEDGMLVTEAIKKVTEQIRPYIPKDTIERVEAYLKSSYSKLRKKAYPPMEMFLDAWVKNDEAGLEEYRQLCLAVKTKYPK